jgi:hypothetical protein
VRAGQCRSVTLGGHIFLNLPIYERGGQTIKDLHVAYTDSFEHTVGFATFRDIVNYSQREVRLNVVCQLTISDSDMLERIYKGMLAKLAQMPYTSSAATARIKVEIKDLHTQWKEMYLFLAYEYSFNHLQLNPPDRIHCCTYAAGGTCHHVRAGAVCKNVMIAFHSSKLEYYRYSDHARKKWVGMTTQQTKSFPWCHC